MPALSAKMEYVVNMSGQELRLVLLSLQGMLATDEDMAAAKELGLVLSHQRAEGSKRAVGIADKHLTNLAEGGAGIPEVKRR